MDSDNRRETQHEPDNDAQQRKRITLADIDGFVNTATALLSHNKIGHAVRDEFDAALIEIANEIGGSEVTRPEAMRQWLSVALAASPEAAEQEPDTILDRQRRILKKEVEIFKVARMQTEWSEVNDQGSILLAALLEDEKDTDEINWLLGLYRRCSFMSTVEFSQAFRAYEQQVLDWNKRGRSE